MKNLRKMSSQITVAIVCCILGFILTFQFRQVNKNEKTQSTKVNSEDITLEVQQYQKQKKELESKIDDLEAKIKNYESSAANANANEQLLKDLDNSRVVNGMVDVKGEGLKITFTPKNTVFDNNSGFFPITPELLASLVNELYAYEAEAVSINDIRITARTGMVQSGKLILIDNNKISPYEKIVVKVIGSKSKLDAYFNFPYTWQGFDKSYNISEDKYDDLVIGKSDINFKYKYAKPVEKK